MKEKSKHIKHWNDELEDSELLSSLKGKNSFDVPDNYFSDLETDVLAKVNSANGSVIMKYVYYLVAASIALIMLFAGLHFSKSQIEKNPLVEKKQINTNKLNPEIITTVDVRSKPKSILNTTPSNDNNIVNAKEDKPVLVVNDNIKPIKSQEVSNHNQVQTNDISNSENENLKSLNSEAEVVIANNDRYISNAIAQNNQSTYNKTITKVLARMNIKQNLFLPSDTCVNNAFVYTIDTVGFYGLSYNWDGRIFKRFTETGVYTLEYYFSDSLIGTDTMKLSVIPKPQPVIHIPSEICNHESLLLNSGINSKDYDYIWSVSSLNRPEVYISNLELGENIIKLEVISCVDTVQTQATVFVNDCKLEIPNVFTPNGDGVNDYFYIKGLNNYPGSSLTVFDRSGNVVFQAMNYKNNWKADDIKAGTYFYSLKLNDKNKTEKGGVINVIR